MSFLPIISPLVLPIAVNFNGSTYLTKVGGFAGINSKLFTCSFWVKISNTAVRRYLVGTSNGANTSYVEIFINTDETLVINSGSAYGGNGFAVTSPSPIVTGSWVHVALSVDLSDIGKRHLYIGGSPVSGVWSIYTDTALDYNNGYDMYVGVLGSTGVQNFIGDVYQLYYAPGQYIDLSISANLQKFYNGGSPVDLGNDGSIPTGTAPALFMDGANETTWHTNKGTGGTFTVGAGALTKATRPT